MSLTWRVPALTAAGALPLAIAPGPGTMIAWLVLVALAVGADLLLAAPVAGLHLERSLPSQVRLGEPAESVLLVRNTGRRRLRGVVRDAWQPSAGAGGARGTAGTRHRLDVRSGEGQRVVTPLLPRRRGDRLSPGVAVRSLGPLRLAARQRSIDLPGRIRVLPPFRSRRHLPSRLAMLREIEGRSAVLVRGQGTEFDSLREYVPGDDVRSIDWRATARRSTVVVRTWRPERDRRVLLVLDASRTAAARIGDETRLDAAMEAALLLGALASRAGDRVDLLVHDRDVVGRVEGASRGDLLRRMTETLAPVEATLVEADWEAVAAQVRGMSSRRALVVLLTPVDAATQETGLVTTVAAMARRHTVVVAAVSDPELSLMARRRGDREAVFDAAAAERSLADAGVAAEWLRLSGASVLAADPEALPPALADHYLSLKAAGRL